MRETMPTWLRITPNGVAHKLLGHKDGWVRTCCGRNAGPGEWSAAAEGTPRCARC